MDLELLDEELKNRLAKDLETISQLNSLLLQGRASCIESKMSTVGFPATLKMASVNLTRKLNELVPSERLRVSFQKSVATPNPRYYLRFRRSYGDIMSTDDVIAMAKRQELPELCVIVRQVLLLNLFQQNWLNFITHYKKIKNNLADTKEILEKEL